MDRKIAAFSFNWNSILFSSILIYFLSHADTFLDSGQILTFSGYNLAFVVKLGKVEEQKLP